MKSEHTLLVHNPDAGTEPTTREEMLALLDRHGLRAEYRDHKADGLGTLLDRPWDLVIAAGGDGTVSDVAAHLQDLECPIGILPLGGSNNVARALGIEGALDDIVAHWSRDRTRGLDIGAAIHGGREHDFVEAVGAGALSHSVKLVDPDPETPAEKRRNGRESFRDTLVDLTPFTCAIEADGWSWSGECLLVEAMNIGSIGPRLALAPDALPHDGQLDIVIAEATDRRALLDWCKRFHGSPPLRRLRARRALITIAEQSFRLDDQELECSTQSESIEVALRQRGVRVLAPTP